MGQGILKMTVSKEAALEEKAPLVQVLVEAL